MKSSYSLAFAITVALVTTFAGAVSSLAMDLGWTGEPMSASGDTIRTNGALVYAYCGGVNGTTTTVNGVAFTVYNRPGSLPAGLIPLFKTVPALGYDSSGFGSEGVSDPEYANILQNGWWLDQKGNFTCTLNDLEANHAYLIQLIIHRSNTDYTVTAPDGATFVKSHGTGWTYGGTLIGVITTTSTSYSFAINYAGSENRAALNAVQVRDLGVAPTVIEPVIGSVSAKASGAAATLSLAGIVMGTGDDTEPATSYSVSYKLGDADPVTALENQTNTTASFTIEDLSDGDYTCEVTITTDKGKTSAAKTVSFTVNSTLGDFDALKAALEGAAPGSTITVAKGTYLATSTITITAANVTLVSSEGKTKTIIDGNAAYRILSVSGGNFTVEGITFKNGCAGATGKGGAINYSSASVAQTTQIKNCDFVDCTAQYGGAIYSGDGSYTSFEPRENYGIVTGCTFLRCGIVTTEYWGGGGAISGALWVENSTFDACYCLNAGGRYHAAIDVPSYMTVTNCIFRNHSQTQRGLVGAAEQKEQIGCVRLVDCLFANNTANTADDVLFHRKVILDRCVISNNATTVVNPLTALYRSDAAGDMEFSKFTSCLFIDNQYPFSLNNGKMPPLLNCTFVRNVGGLAADSGLTSTNAITNCVFWGNTAKTTWPLNATYKGVPGFYYHPAITTMTNLVKIASTAIQGGSTNSELQAILATDPSGRSTTVTADMDAEGPKFADAANGDWSLGRKSVLRDAGVKADWMVGALDLAGNPRLLDAEGLPRLNALPDIGCYEFKNNRAALTIVIR